MFELENILVPIWFWDNFLDIWVLLLELTFVDFDLKQFGTFGSLEVDKIKVHWFKS